MAWMFLAGSVGALPPSPPPNYEILPYHTVLQDVIKDFPIPTGWHQPTARRPAPTSLPVVVRRVIAAPHSATVAEAQAWVYATLGPIQGACLVDIVRHEDGTWDPYRTNLRSGAYGIPQALPGSKMASVGPDWRSNRITQLRWMIGYVNARYGSACSAAAYRDRVGWY